MYEGQSICKTGGLPGILGTFLEYLEPEDLGHSGRQMNAQFGHTCHPNMEVASILGVPVTQIWI